MTKVYFRADGNSNIGLGHVFRSLALVAILKDDFECIFVIRNPITALIPKIEAVAQLITLPLPTSDIEEAQQFAEQHLTNQDIVVLDGYHFKTSYQKIIKTSGVKLVSIDDIYDCNFISDRLINHAGGIRPDYYQSAFYTQFHLGFSYLLLRKVFLTAAQKLYKKTEEKNIFICMGGADTNNSTIDLLRTIEQRWKVDNINCYVVIGQAYLHQKKLDVVVKNSTLNIHLLSNLSAQEMLDYMQHCPLAICPPSGVSFEYLCTGGCLYLYQIADNQKDVKKHLLAEVLAFDFKQDFPAPQHKIKAVIEHQSEQFTGNSPIYLLRIFKQLENELQIRVKKASEQHLMQYFEWANAPEVRKNAFQTNPIPLENHQQWFSKKIQDKKALLLYFEYNNSPLGQVRFERQDQDFIQINYSIDKNLSGQGFGKSILKLAMLHAIEQQFCNKFYGEVKVENIASQKIFQKLSFKECSPPDQGHYTYKLDLSTHV